MKNGLAALSPADYLSTEAAYKQVFATYGIQRGLYDSPEQLSKWIGDDKSPDEIKNRVDAAAQMLNSKDPALVASFQNFYGITRGDLLAYFLDNTQGMQVLQQRAQAAQIGQAGTGQGFNIGRDRAELFASQGVDYSTAQQGFMNAATVLPNLEKSADIYGGSVGVDDYDEDDAINEFVGGLASAQRKRQKLNMAAASDFSGTSGIDGTAEESTLTPFRGGSY